MYSRENTIDQGQNGLKPWNIYREKRSRCVADCSHQMVMKGCFSEADLNAGCFFGGGGALDPNLIVMLEVYTWLMGAIQVRKIVLTEHLCACLKGQCHEMNIF